MDPGLMHRSAAMLAAMLLAAPIAVFAKPRVVQADESCAGHAREAAERSGLTAEMVLRVMRAESAGNPRSTSRRGAMGCMQIMPATWRGLSARHRLGADPYDARMNMIGGALYLAELATRFRFPGAFAAYNAGPSRYERHVRTGTPLPAETLAYARTVVGAPAPGFAAIRPLRWQEAGLFAASATSDPPRAMEQLQPEQSDRPQRNSLFPLGPTGAGASGNLR
jgi:soluble lytic murein transglycosylase-like protein